jgi:4-hydroxybenzoate polyprenyltransferase
MEEEIMIKQIIGLIIGILVLFAGIYYLIKEKNDAQSKKIYTVISVIGAVITVACIVMLVL